MSGREWVPYTEEQIDYQLQPAMQVVWGSTEYISVRAVPVEDYQGPYEAQALFSPQTFATSDRYMTDDFRVNAINYTEAPNESGITVTIGG